MTSIDGAETMDVSAGGDAISEITADGDVVWQAVVTLEDHEAGGVITDYYSGNTSLYSMDGTGQLEGTYSIDGGDQYGELGYSVDTAATPRGYEYRARMRCDSANNPWFLTNVQSPSAAQDDCYYLEFDVVNGEITAGEYAANAFVAGNTATYAIATGTAYDVGLLVESDGITGILYDTAGAELARTNKLATTTHAGGTFGWYQGGTLVSQYFDYVRQV